MDHFARLIALVVIFVMTPVGVELIENGVHLVSEGHSAHGDHGDHDRLDSDAPRHPEHGCTGTFHACSCHAAPTFLVPEASADIVIALQPGRQPSPVGGQGPRAGFEGDVFRPPSA